MKDGRLRIVHTIPSLEHGGVEHFAVRLAEAHRALGHDASIVALWGGGPLAGEARRRGVPVIVLSGTRIRGAAQAALRIALLRPDVLHAHNPRTMHYAALGALLSGARLLVTEHSAPDITSRFPGRLERALVSQVVAVSQATARTTTAAASEHDVVVVHNGVTIAAPARSRDEVRAELGLGDEIVAVHVARFDPLKAHDTLVRALAVARDRGVRLTLLAVGEGRMLEKTKELAAALALGPDRVRFLGWRSDVPDLLAAADFSVLPSRTEGVSLVLLEAMAQRRPIAATAVGGTLEVVRDGQEGILVPVDDVAALAGALERLATDADLRARLGDAAFRRVRDAFSFAATARRYEELYHAVLGSRAGRPSRR